MFGLTAADLGGRIVGCGDGPASFNAEATRRGSRVVSCDPIYQWTSEQIRERIRVTSLDVLEQTRRNRHEFVWTSIRTVEELGDVRLAAMNDFLDDYDAGKAEARYIDATLPSLPFDDGSFDLALSSHFLFLYTAQLGEAFHAAAIGEMCRVSAEVRIFPLLMLGGVPSPCVEHTLQRTRAQGFEASIEAVDYEFQRGANQMMRIHQCTRP